jgi:hypothetical protein
MKTPSMAAACVALCLLCSPAAAKAPRQEGGAPARPLSATERGELQALTGAGSTHALEGWRASAGAGSVDLGPVDRDALARAQAAHPALDQIRAGEITERELTIILATVGVVLLIVLIA